MHYSVKKTLKQLRDADNHYLVCVKPNQARLYQWIEFQWHTAQPSSHYQQHQLEHGRQVQRVIQVFEELGEFAQHWTGRASGKCGMEYYTRQENKLCDRKLCPAYCAVMIRPINTEKLVKGVNVTFALSASKHSLTPLTQSTTVVSSRRTRYTQFSNRIAKEVA